MSSSMHRRQFVKRFSGMSLFGAAVSSGAARAAATTQDGKGGQSARPTTTTPCYWAWWGWEPIDHNRRVGGTAGAVDASAWWLTSWYDRLHSEDLVKLMADVGINLAVTHFFKGFGLKHEHAQQQRTAELVRYAHRHGIRVLGYCQSNSLYYETFLAEEPGAADWVQRDPDGKPGIWGAKYYRWTPCIHSPEFRAYLKKAIRLGLEEVGLDGLNFDNSYSGPCYCDRCEGRFRRWLAERYPQPIEVFGIASFDHVRQPPMPTSTGRIEDPLVRAWVRWRCESLGEYLGDITGYARSLRPDTILLANPSHPVSAGGPLRRSVWPTLVGRHLDLMIAENSASPDIVDGALISQIRAYKQGNAVGYRAVSTTWAGSLGREASDDASSALPQTPTTVRLQVAEAAANGGVPGANWAVRPLGDGNRMRIDRDDLRDALRQYLDFVRKEESIILGARPVRDVAVLHTFASFAFDAQLAWDRVAAAEEMLIRGGFSWEVAFDDNLRLDGFSVLILAGQSHLSDETCGALRAFAKQGGAIVMLGENGRRDDDGRTPATDRLGDIPASNLIRLDVGPARGSAEKRHAVCVRLPDNWKQIVQAIKGAAKGRLSVHLRDASEVAMNTRETNDGRLIVHLVNYAAPQPTRPLQVQLGTAWGKADSVRLRTPGSPERTLALRREGAQVVIDVPPLDVYGILIVA
ncbi:MAG TPA: beta-galactosidase [Verrucomicrobiae bacterium]|nr:beta-galactosidase [Verrucomicrobiae bacterium]